MKINKMKLQVFLESKFENPYDIFGGYDCYSKFQNGSTTYTMADWSDGYAEHCMDSC